MKSRLRSILSNNNTDKALQRKQKADLRQLVSRLVQESERVIQARAKSERDVRGFLKSGLADEHIEDQARDPARHLSCRVGSRLAVAKGATASPSPLPPLAMSIGNLPLAERLLVKQIDQDGNGELNLTVSEADPAEMDEEFWQAYPRMDRAQLFRKTTVAHLQASGQSLTISTTAKALPPTHDLETLAYWLAMARQAGIALDDRTELIDLQDESDVWTRFTFSPGTRLRIGQGPGIGRSRMKNIFDRMVTEVEDSSEATGDILAHPSTNGNPCANTNDGCIRNPVRSQGSHPRVAQARLP